MKVALLAVVLMGVAGSSGERCFVDAQGSVCARPLESLASGRTRVEVTQRGRTFEAEVGDGVIVDADSPVSLEGLTFERVLFEKAHLYLYRADDHDALASSARLSSLVGRQGVRGVSPDLWLQHVTSAFPTDAPNDPEFGGQWYLDTIRARAAWKRSIGDPTVEIAVIDDGCDLQHPDLIAQLLPGRDVVDQDDDPSFTPNTPGNGHGTACAGLIAAATDNASGIAGTCPRCRMRCVKLIAPRGAMVPITADVDAFGFAFTNNVEIASNSWGFGPGVPAPAALVTAITTAIRDGRNGLGMVVVFAAGNDDGVIGADQVAAIPGVIAVGAVNLFDETTPFSNRGPTLALVAPVGTLTLDVSGPAGSDPGDITNSFGGTSSACPIVSGVVGLMLSKKPSLTTKEVRDILMATARRAPFARPNDAGHDDRYGHGVVDADAALAALDAPITLNAAPTTIEAPAAGCGCDGGAVSLLPLLMLVAARRRRS